MISFLSNLGHSFTGLQSQDREVLPQVGRSPVPVFSSSETESVDDEDVPQAAALPPYEAYSDDEQDYDGPSSPHLLHDDQDETDPIDSKEESEEDPEERQLYITQSKFLQYPKYGDDRDLHVADTSRPKEPPTTPKKTQKQPYSSPRGAGRGIATGRGTGRGHASGTAREASTRGRARGRASTALPPAAKRKLSQHIYFK